MTSSASDNDNKSEKGKSLTTIVDKTIMAIGKSTSTVVSGTFFAVLAYKRDALLLSFFAGSIINSIMSKVLKRVLNEERPSQDDEDEISTSKNNKMVADRKPTDKGMPSSHAMSMGFIFTYTMTGIPETSIPLILYLIMSLYYRVAAKLHTKEQVYVGVVLGTLNGIIWRYFTPQITEFTSKYFLPDSGVLPGPYLIIPAVVGISIVGSLERNFKDLIKSISGGEKKTD
eukprot:CAMPEP_0178965932 /NCGR_PEP_ID=MMETSP0789-20121207/16617_1 /TAXON_ID=3005 /ORGANISM="Rhizosolenia setigera, Strain CCMP 1694" /LENGTH=228 /DNA_ID=CAMNT_0020651093 /DNA_START=196 /DNA_END=882 /DNA_ORIENTATION=-